MTGQARPFAGRKLKVRKLTVNDYHRLAEVGVLRPEERVELLDGELVEMSPIGRRHAAYVNRLCRLFVETLPESRAIVHVQNPIVLDDFSEPQPDIALLQSREGGYFDRLPNASDVLLLVEVADSTLEGDRAQKLPRYAAAGIPEVWRINANTHELEVYRHPQAGAYRERQVWQRDARLDTTLALVALPDATLDSHQLLFPTA